MENYLVTYEFTGEEHNDAPIYMKKSNLRFLFDRYLSRNDDGTWHAGIHIGSPGFIKSVGFEACPNNIRRWQYRHANSGPTKDGDITAKCT